MPLSTQICNVREKGKINARYRQDTRTLFIKVLDK